MCTNSPRKYIPNFTNSRYRESYYDGDGDGGGDGGGDDGDDSTLCLQKAITVRIFQKYGNLD